jgi:hypothetical protein
MYAKHGSEEDGHDTPPGFHRPTSSGRLQRRRSRWWWRHPSQASQAVNTAVAAVTAAATAPIQVGQSTSFPSSTAPQAHACLEEL